TLSRGRAVINYPRQVPRPPTLGYDVQTAICANKRVWEMNASAAGSEYSGGGATAGFGDRYHILCFDGSYAGLERAAPAIPGGAGGAMSFRNAPTVSILIICCSFND